jgi:biopolymer transport protein ExbB
MIERIIQLFLAGGWVMYPLLVMSLLSLTLIFERFVFWTFSNQRLGVNRFKSYLVVFASNQVSKAMKDAASDPTLEGELVRSALESKTTNEAILIGYVESMRPSIERFTILLSGIIAAAPLMGILGTVTGIISSFDLLGEAAAVSDPALVAGGIAEALYTTAFGLTIALVTLFPTIYFKSRSQRVLGRLETLAGVIIDAQEHPTQSHDPNLEK